MNFSKFVEMKSSTNEPQKMTDEICFEFGTFPSLAAQPLNVNPYFYTRFVIHSIYVYIWQ